MNRNNNILASVLLAGVVIYSSCKIPQLASMPKSKQAPVSYSGQSDSAVQTLASCKEFFKDTNLIRLIDTALANNQELSIAQQEIAMAKNDILVSKSRLLPRAEAGGGIGMEKVGRYTSQGAGDASTDITPGKPVPDWLPDFRGGIYATWEADIWKKLRNSKKAAVNRYLATVEGRNFITTNLVAEIANGYYELKALDNQMQIVRQTIQLQKNALDIVKIQKQAGAATDLAVKKFEADVLSSETMEKDILQRTKAKENELNFLLGRYPQPIPRDTTALLKLTPNKIQTGIPSQLLSNRPDIKQAELQLQAAKLDVQVAKAEFYPSLQLSSSFGFQAFTPGYLVKLPESLLASLAGDLAGPLINKAAIKAEYANANARQIQALYEYDRSVLNAYTEVSTELSNIQYNEDIFQLKQRETDTLMASITISGDLFRSARADYLEVLLTQRDALDAKLELVEIRLRQFATITNLYRALGGGWK